MALSDTQVRQLRAKLEGKHVKTRKANGTDLHYVEGWHVIAEANRIFGYDAWDRRTIASRCVWSGESGPYHSAAYTAKDRVSVRAGDIIIVREDAARNTCASSQLSLASYADALPLTRTTSATLNPEG